MELILIAIPFFFLMIGLEKIAEQLKKKSVYNLSDSITNLSCGIGQQVLETFLMSALFGLYIIAYDNFAVWKPAQNPFLWLIGFIGVDFTYYWFHRFGHEWSFLWAFHSVHHQSEEYNLSVALRQSWVQWFFNGLFNIPLALLGIPPKITLICIGINTLYQFWIHTRLIGKLGPIEWVFNTPSHHRVHHGINFKYLDKNYGGTLIVWDRLFGTFQAEEDEPVYGVLRPVNSWNPAWVNVEYASQMILLAWNSQYRWSNIFKVWFTKTGWKPLDYKETSPIDEKKALVRKKFNIALSQGLKIYAFIQFACIAVILVRFMYLKPEMPLIHSIAIGAWIMLSLTALGLTLERRRIGLYGEILRLAGLGLWLWKAPGGNLEQIISLLSLISIFWISLNEREFNRYSNSKETLNSNSLQPA